MTRAVKVLELRSVWGTGGGPEKTILLGAGLHDKAEFSVTVCYVRDLRDGVFAVGERARQAGVDYVEIPERHSFDLSAWRQLIRLAADRRVDIVHSHDHKTDIMAFYLARRLGVRPLATSHGWSGYSFRERRVYYPLDIKILARFPAVIAVSSPIRDRLIDGGVPADRITVLLNAIDPAVFRRNAGRAREARRQLALPAEACIVGTVGRLEQVKRFDLLLDAFAHVSATRPNVHLAIVGDGSLRAALETHARTRGVADRCHWLGQLSDVTIAHDAFDVFVQSSESEGTPNAVLEAMAMETPLVATDVGGTAELAHPGEHGIIVPRHDAGALAAAISLVLSDRPAARARTQAARRRVERDLSFAARTRALEAIYRTLAAGRPAARRDRT